MIRRIMGGAIAGALLAACSDDPTGPGNLTPVDSLAITSVPETLLTRQSLRLEVRAFDRQGSLLPDRPVTWESAEPAIASVTAGGVLTAASPGTTVIRAMTGDLADSVTVTVRTLVLEHVFVGASLACGLETTGEAWCWGKVGAEGYGNGSLDSTSRDVPSRAAVGHTFGSLAFTRTSACGIRLSGDVICWGRNERGQLGDGSTAARGTPAPVGSLTGIVQLAAGDSHICARSDAGAVSCWGDNEWLQAGQTTRGIVAQPTLVTLSGPASGITAGFDYSCALVAGQSLCWGSDAVGQLGNDTIYDRLIPALAANGDGVSRTWSEVEASNLHTCGRDTGGAVFCWGVLPSNTIIDADTFAWLPTRRFEGMVATDIAAGWRVQCAVSDQRAWCDGYHAPRVELAAAGAITSVVVAGSEACALQTDGAVACELANQSRGTLTPVPLPAAVVQLAASDNRVCTLDNVAAVYCWSNSETPAPQRVFETLTVTGVYGNSGDRICVTTQSTDVACWRSADGVETTEPTAGRALVALAVGDYHTCGLTDAGAAWCWGENTYGQLGDGTTTTRATAVAVQGGHSFTHITAGLSHTCGLTTAGTIYCWGHGSQGSMGDNRRDESAAPVSVDGTPALTQLGPGRLQSTCGLDAGGSVWCWPTSFETPAAHQIAGAAGLVSLQGPCGLRATGEMLCWGSNYGGWFGNGTLDTITGAAVAGGNGIQFQEVSFGQAGTACGIALDGAAYCWGNTFGTGLGSPEGRGGTATLPLRLYGSP